MRRIIAILFGTILMGCCPCKQLGVTQRDSIAIKVVERVKINNLPINVPIPSDKQTQTRNGSSFLENAVSASRANINEDGSLTHSLWTKPSFNVDIDIPTFYKDSTIYMNQFREIKVEVNKPDTWWEKTQKIGFWGMLALFLLQFFVRRISRGGF